MQIRPVDASYSMWTVKRTDMKNLIAAFGNFGNSPKTQNTHFVFNKFFFFKNHTVYEILWKNFAEGGWLQLKIWRMRFAWWIL